MEDVTCSCICVCYITLVSPEEKVKDEWTRSSVYNFGIFSGNLDLSLLIIRSNIKRSDTLHIHVWFIIFGIIMKLIFVRIIILPS